MRLQIHPVDQIENVLLAAQTVKQANVITSTDDDHSAAYRQAYREGFETTLQRILRMFDLKLLSKKMWLYQDVESLLLTVQAAIQTLESQEVPADEEQGLYRGAETALWCVAISFGVNLLSSQPGFSSANKPFARFGTTTWFLPDDITNILAAIKAAMQAIVTIPEDVSQPIRYYDGFEAALWHVAKLFGVKIVLPVKVSWPGRTSAHWLDQEIESRLLMAYQTIPHVTATFKEEGSSAAYWQGFKAALNCIAISFGIKLV
jgi:hypothetical protein